MRPVPLLAFWYAFAMVLLVACTRQADTSAQSIASAEAAANTLPTLAEAARSPQPAVQTATTAPVVQTLPSGSVQLGTDLISVEIERVTYTPYGVEIDAVARKGHGTLGGIVHLNYGDRGVLRDDRGNTYRLRDPEGRLQARFAGKDDRWALQLVALGFLPTGARRLSLGLNLNSLGSPETLVEASWDIPAGVAALRRVRTTDRVRAGRGWDFAIPPAGNSPDGQAALRVHSVDWLRDGIALTLEALNASRDVRISLNSANWQLRLVDDRGHVYRIVENADPALRGLPIANGERVAGRLLFAPGIAPDAMRLRLLTNGGPVGKNPWAAIPREDDNMFAPRLAVNLGAIPPPARLRGASAPAPDVRIRLPQPPLPTAALAVSRIDPIARLKRELGATDSDAGTAIDLPSDVLFDFDSARLRADARPTIDALADLLRRVDRPATIAGHTDARGGGDYNMQLSLRRAEAVRRALVEAGIDAARLSASGYGASRPKRPNTRPDGSDDPEARQANRRVEVRIPRI